MKTTSLPFRIRLLLVCALAVSCGCLLRAQTIFYASSLPTQIGQFYRAYYGTNVNLTSLLGQTNGPQQWDFSQPGQPGEIIQRTDIVPTTDGGNDGSFPDATFAERDTNEPDSQIAWRYYSMTNAGRLYYGFYTPVNDPASPLVVFDQPTLDVPETVQFGQTWTRSVAWTNIVLLMPIAYHFTATAQVDAYGTLVLPGIGQVPALRVRELHNYEGSWYLLDDWFPFLSKTDTNYFWLSPTVGLAARITLVGDNTLFPSGLPYTNSLLRVFQSSVATNQAAPYPVTGLRIRLESSLARLDWNLSTNSSGYRVENIGSLGATNWQLLAMPSTNSWSDTLTATQRFYRVFAVP